MKLSKSLFITASILFSGANAFSQEPISFKIGDAEFEISKGGSIDLPEIKSVGEGYCYQPSVVVAGNNALMSLPVTSKDLSDKFPVQVIDLDDLTKAPTIKYLALGKDDEQIGADAKTFSLTKDTTGNIVVFFDTFENQCGDIIGTHKDGFIYAGCLIVSENELQVEDFQRITINGIDDNVNKLVGSSICGDFKSRDYSVCCLLSGRIDEERFNTRFFFIEVNEETEWPRYDNIMVVNDCDSNTADTSNFGKVCMVAPDYAIYDDNLSYPAMIKKYYNECENLNGSYDSNGLNIDSFEPAGNGFDVYDLAGKKLAIYGKSGDSGHFGIALLDNVEIPQKHSYCYDLNNIFINFEEIAEIVNPDSRASYVDKYDETGVPVGHHSAMSYDETSGRGHLVLCDDGVSLSSYAIENKSDVQTGIENVIVNSEHGGEWRYYDLQGRLVGSPTSGIYIRQNGSIVEKISIR